MPLQPFSPIGRSISVVAVLGILVCIIFTQEKPHVIESDAVSETNSNSVISKASPSLNKGPYPQKLIEVSSPELTDPRNWRDTETLLSEIIPIEGDSNLFERRRIVRSQGFEQPVLLIEGIVVDPIEGEVVYELYDSMIANQLIVSSKSSIGDTQLATLLVNTGWTVKKISRNGLITVLQTSFAELKTVENGVILLRETLGQSPDLVVEPNRIYYASITEPDDPLYVKDKLWGLDNDEDFDIDAPEGWDIRTDAQDIVIAITDTGIREDHEDLIDNLWNNVDEVPNNGIDDDNNGYIDDDFGINILDPSLPPSDDSGHGTRVAGITGASGNNGVGMSGIAWQTNLMAVKFMNASGRGTLENAIAAIDYAIENGADIINASWGSEGESSSLESALERALDAGVFVVAAAGNESENIDHNYYLPASSALSNVITVASINQLGHRSGFSNYGIGATDLAAPGNDILSTSHLSSDAYSLDSGSSLAAPFVSGILALNLSQWPEDDIQTQVDRLIVSSKPRTRLSGTSRSRGIVSLGQSLAMETVPYPPIIVSHSELNMFELAGLSTSLSVDVSSPYPVNYQWYFENNLLSESTSSELVLTSISESNQGKYKFTAINQDGEATIEFELTVLTPDSELAAGLDTDSPNIVYTPNDTLWSIATDPLSKAGDHIEGRYPTDKLQRNTITAIVQGAGKLQFLWNLTGVIGSPSRPEFYVEGNKVATYRTQDEWQLVEYILEDKRNYEITWSFWNSGDADTEQGRLLIDHLKVNKLGQGPPVIYRHPENAISQLFNTAWFSIGVSGEDLEYVWFFNESPTESSFGKRLRISEVSLEDEGDYYVVVSNQYGSDTSLSASLEVDQSQTPAHLLETSATFKGIAGDSLDVSIPHVGSPPITYKWFKENVELTGQTGRNLSFNPLRKEHGGRYSVQIENPYGRLVAGDVYVDVIDRNLSPSAILDERDTYTVRYNLGNDIEFDYYIQNEFYPVEFQWYKDGIPMEGQTSQRLFIENATHDDAGIYAIETRNDLGVFRDEVLEIIINLNAQSVSTAILDTNPIPDSQDETPTLEMDELDFGQLVGDSTFDVCDGDVQFSEDTEIFVEGEASAYATLEPAGGNNFFKLCRRDTGGNIYTATQFKIKLKGYDDQTQITVTDNVKIIFDLELTESWQTIDLTGNSDVIGFNIIKPASSNLEIWIDDMHSDTGLRVIEQPKHYATYLGGSAHFSAEAASSGNILYQWRHNGKPIFKANSNQLSFETVTEKDLGDYDVYFKSNGEQVFSEVASLSLVEDLGVALEIPGLKVSTWGDSLWTIDKKESIDGTSSLRSGDLEHTEFSTLRIEFDMPGMYSLYTQGEGLEGEKSPWYVQTGISESGSDYQEFTMRRPKVTGIHKDGRYMRLDRLSFSSLTLQSYNQWLQRDPDITDSITRDESILDELQDSDGDSVVNFLEFLFDLNPLERSTPPHVSFFKTGDQTQAIMDYRFAATGEYTIKFEASSNLRDWFIMHPQNVQTLDTSSLYYNTQSIINLPVSATGSAFIRWSVLKTGPGETPLESK